MTSCEVETSPSVAIEHSKSKTYELRTRGFQSSFVLSPEELGSTSAELIRILLFHSYPQRASVVSSPPIEDSNLVPRVLSYSSPGARERERDPGKRWSSVSQNLGDDKR